MDSGYTVWYPKEHGEFPTDTHPPDELEEIAVAWYYGSMCRDCGTDRRVRSSEAEGGEWRDVSVEELCRFIADYNETCGGCLIAWSGGGGK